VTRLGGSVRVLGSTFEVRLPLTATILPAAVPAAPAPAPATATATADADAGEGAADA
jgi:hypothetical protein